MELSKTNETSANNPAEQFAIPEDIAIQELKDFIEFHLDKSVTEEDVKAGYEDAIKALRRGFLNIADHSAPSLILKEPILSESGGHNIESIKFLTRIKPTALAALAKGIDITKDQMTLVNRMTAHLIQQPAVAILDKFGKVDMKVISQITGLFQ